MAKRYYSLIIQESQGEPFAPQFGDYNKGVVAAELSYYRDKGYKTKQLWILKSGEMQQEINSAVAKFNSTHANVNQEQGESDSLVKFTESNNSKLGSRAMRKSPKYKYTVQMFYSDSMGGFWDDVSPLFNTRTKAIEQMGIHNLWLLADGDYETELRVYCYRKPRQPQAPRPIERRRMISPRARVAAPVLIKRYSPS